MRGTTDTEMPPPLIILPFAFAYILYNLTMSVGAETNKTLHINIPAKNVSAPPENFTLMCPERVGNEASIPWKVYEWFTALLYTSCVIMGVAFLAIVTNTFLRMWYKREAKLQSEIEALRKDQQQCSSLLQQAVAERQKCGALFLLYTAKCAEMDMLIRYLGVMVVKIGEERSRSDTRLAHVTELVKEVSETNCKAFATSTVALKQLVALTSVVMSSIGWVDTVKGAGGGSAYREFIADIVKGNKEIDVTKLDEIHQQIRSHYLALGTDGTTGAAEGSE